jgi:hypothetical protein
MYIFSIGFSLSARSGMRNMELLLQRSVTGEGFTASEVIPTFGY